jgi:hypothetical protein
VKGPKDDDDDGDDSYSEGDFEDGEASLDLNATTMSVIDRVVAVGDAQLELDTAAARQREAEREEASKAAAAVRIQAAARRRWVARLRATKTQSPCWNPCWCPWEFVC